MRNQSWLTDVDKITKIDLYQHWRNNYWCVDGDNPSRAFIKYDDDGATVSEAIGWGMLISVMMDKKADFDALLAYYHAHGNKRTNKSSPDGFMVFRQVQRNWPHDNKMMNDPSFGDGAATDAELDVALALLLAGEKPQWGQYYHDQGVDLCQNLLHVCMNPDSNMPMVGDWAWGEQPWNINDNNSNIQAQMRQRFPDGRKTATRSVDWMLAHYKTFAQLDGARKDDWDKVFAACASNYSINVNRQGAHQKTGLIPDFLYYTRDSGPKEYTVPAGKVLEDDYKDTVYSYNACRVPWKLAAYYKSVTDFNSHDWTSVSNAVWTMKGFFEDLILNKNEKVKAGYKLDGTAFASNEDIAFTAPVWRLLKVMGANAAADKVGADICRLINDGQSSYYGDTILLLSYLQTE